MSASDLQALLRFLSQDAKVPLAMAMGKVKDLQAANLDSADKLAKTKPAELKSIFEDEKVIKQIIAAAKRVSKKRAAGEDLTSTPPKKKAKNESLFSNEPVAPADLEDSLKLPSSTLSADELEGVELHTNRAPLVLAFLVILLKHTMPEQPLSSRLSLAQAYVSVTSRSRAVYLGIESGKSAEEEGFGEGQPFVTVAGKEIKVLRRWGYEWKPEEAAVDKVKTEETVIKTEDGETADNKTDLEEQPPLWALDLEALKKSGSGKQPAATQAGNHSGLPIYTPQSARAYLLKSFDSPANKDDPAAKKPSAAARVALKEQNLGKLLRALDLLYDSWAPELTPAELDKRTWSWYVKVRPPVEDGVAGWGEKNRLKLSDILALRHLPET
ncbi:Putative Impact family protein [Septoria linicola]|uniref:Impact family protein n=1 Tax=Septoria linicola TaxID=215465 RepID=A0A9Q9B1J8_9PEZI|nr:Putative Impact family protein [Septoria linicola]